MSDNQGPHRLPPEGAPDAEGTEGVVCKIAIRGAPLHLVANVIFSTQNARLLQDRLRHSLTPVQEIGNFLNGCQFSVTLVPVPLSPVAVPHQPGPDA